MDNNNVQTAVTETSSEDKSINIPVAQILIGAMATAALVLGVMNFRAKEEKIRVVDLAGIAKTYQEQAKQQGLQDGISNEQRGQILQNLQAKMNTLQQVIMEYTNECQCNVFVKSAIVGRSNNVEDISTEIAQRINKRVPESAVVTSSTPTTENSTPIPTSASGK